MDGIRREVVTCYASRSAAAASCRHCGQIADAEVHLREILRSRCAEQAPAELRARIHRFGEEMEQHYGDAFCEDHVPPPAATARRLTGEYRAIGEALGREGFTVRLGTTWWL